MTPRRIFRKRTAGEVAASRVVSLCAHESVAVPTNDVIKEPQQLVLDYNPFPCPLKFKRDNHGQKRVQNMAKNMTQIQTFRQTMETNWQYCNRINNDNIPRGSLWIPHYSPIAIAACGKSVSCALTICMARTMDWTSRNQWRDAFFHNQIIKHPWNIPKQCWTANSPGKNLSKHHAQRTCFFSQHRNLPVGQGITLKKHSWHAKCTFNMPQSSSKRFLRHYPSSFWSLFWTRKKCDSMGNVLLPQ